MQVEMLYLAHSTPRRFAVYNIYTFCTI